MGKKESKLEQKKDKTPEKKDEKENNEDEKEDDEEDDDEEDNDEEEDDDEDEYEDDEDDEEEKSEEKAASKSKALKDIDKDEMVRLAKMMHKTPRKGPTNPKCTKRTAFRSATIIFNSACPTCRQKEPIPSEKIYTERTVELGIFIDPPLFKRMADVLKTTDEKEVKQALLERTHSLLIETETFLTHNSFSTLEGGFKLAINGIYMYKDANDNTRRWESDNFYQMFNQFSVWASENNNGCDAEVNSYDGMVLLTGRNEDLSDVNRGSSKGYASTCGVCHSQAAIALTLRLDDTGEIAVNAGRLLAHEFGHLLGAYHDGEPDGKKIEDFKPHNPYAGVGISCPDGQDLMARSVSSDMKVFSSCTQKQIDAENEWRIKDKKDCLYT